jgi:hypothetical protein
MHVAVMIPCDQAQNTIHHNIAELKDMARRSKILHARDVTTALPNTRFDRSGIPTAADTAKELVAKMFNKL